MDCTGNERMAGATVTARRDPADLERRRGVRRRLLRLSFGAVFLSGTMYALFGDGGVAERMRLTREHSRLETDVAARKARIRQLEDAANGLRVDPLHRERIAREQLGYARPGEIVFLLPAGP